LRWRKSAVRQHAMIELRAERRLWLLPGNSLTQRGAFPLASLKIPHDALVLIGDGEKALFLRNKGDEKFPKLAVERHLDHPNPPTHVQGSDQPGHTSDAFGRKSALENADWHRLEKDRFAKEIAGTLYRLAHENSFKALVVVAPPHVLGRLRTDFHAEVKKRIVAEVDKTLTQHPVHEIERVLTKD
jgi:protein required for attachment to host cells